MTGIDNLLALFGSAQFLMNCLATYAVIHVARANASVLPPESRRWVKLGIDVANLAVGVLVSLSLDYSSSLATNVVVGLISSLFSAQVYQVVKRYLPEKLGGELDDVYYQERRKPKTPPKE